ncbi:hypothetical protein OJF2_44870 [Aquisphaera giovannonii]|uniref:Uncharacterized protein n=1 Tax=Aquisphaera giovannonii TaxID=406548 RepID=A0A5B9W7N2_9BACT|nr:hypothetical protein [Aquisphaera giovannonii]QEH35930.1 hypothetical protein OJF2_44870 [Aquisphaera giovannonii]
MSTRHYHNPPAPSSTRGRCPICNQPVYSRAGIHPQCAMRQADGPRLKSKGADAPAPSSLIEGEIP